MSDRHSDMRQAQHSHDHDHSEGIFGENTELYVAILSGVFWIVGIIATFVLDAPRSLVLIIYGISIFLGAIFPIKEAYAALRQRIFDIDTLMIVAAAGAMALGAWGEAALLLFLFSLGHALEHFALRRAHNSISSLVDLTVPTALLKINDEIKEVDVENLNIGDVIIVKPYEKVAADGVVIKGNSAVDQSPITGESVPVDKVATDDKPIDMEYVPEKSKVYSGTMNGSGMLEVRVLREAHDSTLAKLITLVTEAKSQKSPTQLLTDKIERIYVPAVLSVVVLLMFANLVIDETFSESFYRAMTVLVAASPCALALSTPSAVLAGVARAARNGVLVKGGGPLEKLGDVVKIAFDKTGTLTKGQPRLTHIVPFEGIDEAELLATAVSVETLSDHPLARAIVRDGEQKLVGAIPVSRDLEELTARGVRAMIGDQMVHIGNRRLMQEITNEPVPTQIDQHMQQLEEKGNTAMIVHRGDHYMGIIAVMDVAREEAMSVINRLKKIGLSDSVMLTGDNQKVAYAIAEDIGISDVRGNLLPKEKLDYIQKLINAGDTIAMVGDGVNDAPAMARSDVGIAMGAAGSDVALETADIALMGDSLDKLPFAIGLSRQANKIIKQNLIISFGMVAILVPLALFGLTSLGPAVLGHEGSTLVVVMNALRLLSYKED